MDTLGLSENAASRLRKKVRLSVFFATIYYDPAGGRVLAVLGVKLSDGLTR
jgi:hypothetical protein